MLVSLLSFHLINWLCLRLYDRLHAPDDWGVIAITDANFGRYQITAEDLHRSMNSDPKVFTALICIGEGGGTPW